MNSKHQAVFPPSDENIRIWRYMDFTKFVWMIEHGSLFFTRSDLLGDPFEGSYSKANIENRPKVYKKLFEDVGKLSETFTMFSDLFRLIRKWIFINCWHMNEHESAAMWKLYSKSSESIAIQSTYKRLRDCLPKKVDIGTVQYIDYESDWLPEGNVFYPFFHKRRSFEHENELRAIVADWPILDGQINLSKDQQETGKSFEVDLNILVESLYVAPYSAAWFSELVKRVASNYLEEKAVFQSSLTDSPVF